MKSIYNPYWQKNTPKRKISRYALQFAEKPDRTDVVKSSITFTDQFLHLPMENIWNFVIPLRTNSIHYGLPIPYFIVLNSCTGSICTPRDMISRSVGIMHGEEQSVFLQGSPSIHVTTRGGLTRIRREMVDTVRDKYSPAPRVIVYSGHREQI